jgi:hypothetical protein
VLQPLGSHLSIPRPDPLALPIRQARYRQAVQFDVTKGPKGWQAENVKAV